MVGLEFPHSLPCLWFSQVFCLHCFWFVVVVVLLCLDVFVLMFVFEMMFVSLSCYGFPQMDLCHSSDCSI